MTSIRRRTATLVALSMAALLAVGGVVLLIVLRRAMTSQFDDALGARAAALQSLTHFDGVKTELDFAGEAMPRYARQGAVDGNDEYFIAWVRDGPAWRVLESSGSLRDRDWPTPAMRDGAPGIRDLPLPDASAGRGVLLEFTPPRERDEEADPRGNTPAAAPAGPAFGPPVRIAVALSRAPLDGALAAIGWCIAGVGAALALASIAAARWAISRGLAPLGDLSRRVGSLGPDSLGTRFDAAGWPEELRPIAEQLSALLARLDDAFEREKRFSAAASHELRTPIAELQMLLEVAASRPRSNEQWTRTAGIALGVLDRAKSLCEALLRLSRAGADRPPPDAAARAEIGPVLAEQAARAVSAHRDDPRRIRAGCVTGLFARVDPAALASVLGNVLDNALRHGTATPKSPVVARATADHGRIRIVVSNPAPDLTADDASRLFEPFWRKDASRSARGGFGLGLTVARALARAHGGELTAELDNRHTLHVHLDLPAQP